MGLVQVFTNPERQVAVTSKLCTLAPNIYGSYVGKLFNFPIVARNILMWLLDFPKIYAPLV